MDLVTIVIGGLVTWRISHMIVKESGPVAIFDIFRAFLAKNQKTRGGLFDLVSCVACTSIYIGAIASLFATRDVFEFFLYTLSFSAIASIVERLTR